MTNTSVSKNKAFNTWGLIIGLAVAVIFLHQNATAAQLPVNLGSASRFAVLAASEITSVPTSAIKGDVGISPSARSRIAGLTAVEVTDGLIYAPDDPDAGNTKFMLEQAKDDLTTAYNDAAGRTPVPVSSYLNPGGGNIGGLTLFPGLYKFTSDALISGSNLTLDGSASDVWIFQIESQLTVADGIHVILSGDAQAYNIFWQVGTSATLGKTVIFKGTIMADQSISLNTLARLDGRALARIGAVTLDSNTINKPSNTIPNPILVSAAVVTGPYTDAAGQSVNPATRTITVPVSGSMQFYQIRAGTALTIASITISAGTVVITYN